MLSHNPNVAYSGVRVLLALQLDGLIDGVVFEPPRSSDAENDEAADSGMPPPATPWLDADFECDMASSALPAFWQLDYCKYHLLPQAACQ